MAVIAAALWGLSRGSRWGLPLAAAIVGALALFFGYKLVMTGKLFPPGIMFAASAAALISLVIGKPAQEDRQEAP